MTRALASLPLLFVPALAGAVTPPTFSGDVYPILRAKCQGCHRRGEIAPMAFTNYQDVRPWAGAIASAVKQGTMPPWHADARASMAFQNARSLTAGERDTIVAWAAAGGKEGPRGDYPAPAPRGQEGWKLGKPDLVLRVPGYRVPAKGDVPYTFVAFPTGLKQDTWVSAAEWRIDKRALVHHMNAFTRPPGSSYVEGYQPREFFVPSLTQRRVGRPNEGAYARRELLIGYEPGYAPIPWGARQAKLVKAGSDIVFEIHYNPNGEEAVDSSELALYFAREAPAERVISLSVQNMNFVIPPGDGNFRSDASVTFAAPVKLVSVQPHMHLRGKAMKIEAALPAASSPVSVIDVPRYDFHWQTTYFLREPMTLPPGTRLDCTAWFDNSPNNKYNPDPKASVPWGDQSRDEMHIGFVEVSFDAALDADKVLAPAAK